MSDLCAQSDASLQKTLFQGREEKHVRFVRIQVQCMDKVKRTFSVKGLIGRKLKPA